jgi:hypothetical protein
MAEAVPQIAHAGPEQVKRVDKRYKASGKLKELVESVDRLRSPMIHGAVTTQLLQRIQRLAIEAENDLSANEREKFSSLLLEEVPEIDDALPPLTTGAVMKLAVPPTPPKLPVPPSFVKAPPKRRRSRIVFRKSTDLPTTRHIPR